MNDITNAVKIVEAWYLAPIQKGWTFLLSLDGLYFFKNLHVILTDLFFPF
jgi:hypothetical protein